MEIYIFNQQDDLLSILSEDNGLISAPFRDELNQIPSTPLEIEVDSEVVYNNDISRDDGDKIELNVSPSKHLREGNKVVFKDREKRLREYTIKEIDDLGSVNGHRTLATCIPSWVDELGDVFVIDKRYSDESPERAMLDLSEGTNIEIEVRGEFGKGQTNFYRETGLSCISKVQETWGGDILDEVVLNEYGRIEKRKLVLISRVGEDNGLRLDVENNLEEIERTVLSYPKTALYGWGASLETEGGGHSRYIDFGEVEWKESNGDPIDKPKGQLWVGDPTALDKVGRVVDGEKVHRYGEYSDQNIEEPEKLLEATWIALQSSSEPEINYRLAVSVLDNPAKLGDTGIALDRGFSRPIEIQSRVIAIEYDLVDIDNTTVIEMGSFLDLIDDRVEYIEDEVDKIRDEINKPIPPISDEDFPDIEPGTPVNVLAEGAFQSIQLFWDYDSAVYISHYEVYGSRVSDFIPDDQHLLYRGRVSSFNHAVDTDETWYYYIKAVNTHGTAGNFSEKVSASSARIINDDILFGEINADKLSENLDLANKLSEGTLDWINEDPLYEISQAENRILYDVGNRIGDVVNDINNINEDLGNLHYQDTQINERIDGIDTTVQETTGVVNDLTGEVEHHTTQISSFNQRAGEIEQSVTNVEGDLTNAFTQIGSIRTEADNISLSVSELTTDFENLEIGGRNLVLDSASRQFVYNTSFDLSDISKEYNGKSTVLSFTLKSNVALSFRVDIGNRGLGTSFSYTDINNEVDYVFKFSDTDMPDKITFSEQNGNPNQEITLSNIQLEKGNMATGWNPAPEDLVDSEQIISYINLSSEGIRIHGDKIWITGQTSIDEGVIGTAAIAELAVDKFHLKQGIIDNAHIEDATIEHGKMKSLNVDHVIAGQMSLNYLKAGTIDTDKFLVRGGSATDYTMIDGSYLESRGQHTRTWQGITEIHDVKLRFENGYLRARNDTEGRSLYFSDFGISTYADGSGNDSASGTLAFRDTSYSNSLGLTVNSIWGAVALQSENNRIVLDANATVNVESETSSVYLRPFKMSRPGHNAFRFWIKDGTDASATDGVLTFGNVNVGQASGLRFQKSTSGAPLLWVTNGNGDKGTGRIRADRFIGDLSTAASFAYVRAERLRVVQGSDDNNYSDIQFKKAYLNSLSYQGSGDLYIGVSTYELRVTNNLHWNDGDTGYRPIRARNFYGGSGDTMFSSPLSAILESSSNQVYLRSNQEARVVKSGTWNSYIPIRADSFPTGSSELIKRDIKKFEGSALDLLNSSIIYDYTRRSSGIRELGFIIEREIPEIVKFDNESVNGYTHRSLNTKAIQEVDLKFTNKVVNIEDRLDEKDLQIQFLQQKLAQQDKKIKQLEERVA